MVLRDVYYAVKPVVPRSVRMAVRRSVARRLRRRVGHVWPIDRESARVPPAWPGWPNGKAFAFVLTHDVEGRKGLDRCRRLAELELGLGYRSAFNFVPEGEYAIPASLRSFLNEQGFEVGVHDLHHDGKLYRSRRAFGENATRINQYLRSWGAVGFRSAFMLHNLEWLQNLDILYDASTFDTDPFEPQPDAARTVFPFWVARNGAEGFVELPYTLPQDSTLFLVLGDRGIDVWKSKLEWLAAHGGMALVNVHPDYINFEGRRTSAEYEVELYRSFLEHVTNRYHSVCWFALPRDVAEYARRFRPASPRHSALADDPLPRAS